MMSSRTSPQTGVAIPQIGAGMEYYVYMMTNAHKNVLYVGVTNDLVRRVYEHKHHLDKGSYTSRYNAEYLV